MDLLSPVPTLPSADLSRLVAGPGIQGKDCCGTGDRQGRPSPHRKRSARECSGIRLLNDCPARLVVNLDLAGRVRANLHEF